MKRIHVLELWSGEGVKLIMVKLMFANELIFANTCILYNCNIYMLQAFLELRDFMKIPFLFPN